MSEVHSIWNQWTQVSLTYNEGNFLVPFLHLAVLLSHFLTKSTHWRTELGQAVTTDHTFDSLSFFSCLQVVFPAHTTFRYTIFTSLGHEYLFYSFFFGPCRPEILGLFTLLIYLLFYFTSSLLLSLFLDIVSFFSEKKEGSLFEIGNFRGIFGTGLIFKSVEAVSSLFRRNVTRK